MATKTGVPNLGAPVLLLKSGSMAKRRWTIEVNGAPRLVEVSHSWISGVRVVTLDGQEVLRTPRKLKDEGSDHLIDIDGHEVVVAIRISLWVYYDLYVDGLSVKTGYPLGGAPSRKNGFFKQEVSLPTKVATVIGISLFYGGLIAARVRKDSKLFVGAIACALIVAAISAVSKRIRKQPSAGTPTQPLPFTRHLTRFRPGIDPARFVDEWARSNKYKPDPTLSTPGLRVFHRGQGLWTNPRWLAIEEIGEEIGVLGWVQHGPALPLHSVADPPNLPTTKVARQEFDSLVAFLGGTPVFTTRGK
jgi:hypothetical protein